MPIFPRRQLQLMLDELGPWLTKSNAADLLGRLEKDDPDQSIPAEYELAVGWALSKHTELAVGPDFGRVPDFLSRGLFPERPAVIEVTALSDDSFSGQPSMNRTANIINQFADTVRKKASKNLHYTFLETSDYRRVPLKVPLGPFTHKSQYFRTRLTSKKFELTSEHKSELRKWIANWPPATPLQIKGEGTAVVISWKDWVHPFTKTFSSMPSEAYSLTDNLIYERLKEKEKQVASAPVDHLKCIVLGDAGCRLLREPNDFDGTGRRVSGKDIIQQFLADSNVDIVCVLTPKRRNENAGWHYNNPRLWHTYIFDRFRRDEGYHDGLVKLSNTLPEPRLHGYQARSWMQQGMLEPQARGQYLPLSYSGGNNGVTAKLSARALLELLAGRMDAQAFKTWITREDRNIFEFWLAKGYSISAIEFESKGAEHDDDYVVIKFAQDPNASKLRLPYHMISGGDLKNQENAPVTRRDAARSANWLSRFFHALRARFRSS